MNEADLIKGLEYITYGLYIVTSSADGQDGGLIVNTVFQVTALVGYPVTIESLGFETYRYAAIDGAQYQIVWTVKDGASVVSGVRRIENPSEAVGANRLLPWVLNHLASAFLLAAIMLTWKAAGERKGKALQKQEG